MFTLAPIIRRTIFSIIYLCVSLKKSEIFSVYSYNKKNSSCRSNRVYCIQDPRVFMTVKLTNFFHYNRFARRVKSCEKRDTIRPNSMLKYVVSQNKLRMIQVTLNFKKVFILYSGNWWTSPVSGFIGFLRHKGGDRIGKKRCKHTRVLPIGQSSNAGTNPNGMRRPIHGTGVCKFQILIILKMTFVSVLIQIGSNWHYNMPLKWDFFFFTVPRELSRIRQTVVCGSMNEIYFGGSACFFFGLSVSWSYWQTVEYIQTAICVLNPLPILVNWNFKTVHLKICFCHFISFANWLSQYT